MLPAFVFFPRSPAEQIAAAVWFALAALAAFVASRRKGQAAVVATFGAYFAGGLGLVFAAHALSSEAPLQISTYSVMLVLGVLIAWTIVHGRWAETGLPPGAMYLVSCGCLIFGLAGARVAHLLGEYVAGATATEVLAELIRARRQAGLSVFGAFAGAGGYLTLLFRWRYPAHSLARTLDIGTSAMAVNLAFARVGCLLAGCCFGAPAPRPGFGTFDVSAFAPDSPAGAHYAFSGVPQIWASQFMEVLVALVLVVAAELLRARKRRVGGRDGTVIASAAALYGALRTLIEFARADSPTSIAGVLTIWQLLGLALTALALAFLLSPRVVATPDPS